MPQGALPRNGARRALRRTRGARGRGGAFTLKSLLARAGPPLNFHPRRLELFGCFMSVGARTELSPCAATRQCRPSFWTRSPPTWGSDRPPRTAPAIRASAIMRPWAGGTRATRLSARPDTRAAPSGESGADATAEAFTTFAQQSRLGRQRPMARDWRSPHATSRRYRPARFNPVSCLLITQMICPSVKPGRFIICLYPCNAHRGAVSQPGIGRLAR